MPNISSGYPPPTNGAPGGGRLGIVRRSFSGDFQARQNGEFYCNPNSIDIAQGINSVAESGEFSWAFNTVMNFSHGIGRLPKIVQVAARCKTAEFGYAVGDEVNLGGFGSGGTSVQHAWVNGGNVGFLFNGQMIQRRDSLGNFFAPTPANWRIVLRVWG